MQVVLAGMGSLGSAIARWHSRLEKDLIVYNRTTAAAWAVSSAHVRVVESLAEIEAGAMILTCLTDAGALRSFIPRLFAQAAGPSVVANLSTIGPAASTELRSMVESLGAHYVECPVTGGPESAERGVLTCFLSCDDAIRECIEERLRLFCKSVYRVGARNEAQAVKVINNLMEAVNLCGAAEALALAERFGLSVPQIADALLGGRGASVYLHVLLQGIAADYWQDDPRVSLNIRAKDLKLAEEMLDAVGLRSPVVRETAHQIRAATGLLGGAVDQTQCFEYFQREDADRSGQRTGPVVTETAL